MGCLSGRHDAGRQDFDLVRPPPGGKRRFSDRDQTPAPWRRHRAVQMASKEQRWRNIHVFFLQFLFYCIKTGDSSETHRSGIDVSGARWEEILIEWDDEHIKVGKSSLEMAIDFDQQLQFYSVGGLMAMWETENCCQVISIVII